MNYHEEKKFVFVVSQIISSHLSLSLTRLHILLPPLPFTTSLQIEIAALLEKSNELFYPGSTNRNF